MNDSEIIEDFITYLNKSPTAWHAVEHASQRLKEASFEELSEGERWDIKPEKKYFTTKNGSSLCAFITPKEKPKKVNLLASHTDSPSLKLKPHPEIRKHQALLLGVEVYGSPLLSSWLNRDLGIAGRVIYTDLEGKTQEAVVKLDKHPLVIPQLAIHLDREVNEKGLLLNKQEHLNALAGLEGSIPENSSYLELLLKEIIPLERLIAHDLFLYPLEKALLTGYQETLLSAYRLDSLSSVHAALTALTAQLKPLKNELKMIVLWDNEEVGSQTAQGASSPFLSQVLERVTAAFMGDREDYFCMTNRSTCISIDLAHALNPNCAEKHDPQHYPFLGKGVVLKTNAQQRYATSASSSLPVKIGAKLKGIPLQTFVGRNDIPCGTTIGPIGASQMGMSTIDIGCGQLSMHSCRELMACQDHIDMCRLLEVLLNQTAAD